MAGYAGVLTSFALAVLGLGVLLALRALARRRAASMLPPPPPGPAVSPRTPAMPPRLAVRYFRMALLFVVQIAAVVMILPLAVTFAELPQQSLVAMLLFALPLVVGLAHAGRKGLFRW